MPTILQKNGYRFFFYSNDHLPIHIHIEKDDKTAKFEIENLELVYDQENLTHLNYKKSVNWWKKTLIYFKINGMSILAIKKSKSATDISFEENKMIIFFEDGREIVYSIRVVSEITRSKCKSIK
jgi:hypothetical protein